MKHLKNNQKHYWCSYCEPQTTKAICRETGSFNIFACAEHKDTLINIELKKNQQESMTEADYQTWMRL